MKLLTRLLCCSAAALTVCVHGHHCGEAPVIIQVGQRAIFRITADVAESQETLYNVSINSDPSIASVAPDNFQSFAYGDFTITGLKPGTNTMVLEWAYPPNDASGFCVVTVAVVEPSSDPRDVADETTAADAEESGGASDPVNTYTLSGRQVDFFRMERESLAVVGARLDTLPPANRGGRLSAPGSRKELGL